jgi:5-methylcytosine-specific restriction protein A
MAERNPAWIRDELILALDLYLQNPTSPPGKTSRQIHQLSNVLNRLGAQLGLRRGAKFRNANGVYMKLMNFRRFDPRVPKGRQSRAEGWEPVGGSGLEGVRARSSQTAGDG